jgi:hypothetical protein
MGIPTSEVGYTSATTRRETTKSMTDMWWHWKTTITTPYLFSLFLTSGYGVFLDLGQYLYFNNN